MSGIAVLLHPGGDPISLERLRRASERLAHRGPDGAGEWIRGNVGLAQRAFHSTPESERERQPWVDRERGVVAVLDGRLDARDDLAESLGSEIPPDVPDVAFVAAAYNRWGVDCFERLIGDFAIALWDSRARRLVAARDPLGIRPLYYRHTPHELFIASELAPIALDGDAIRPNEGFVAECLANAVTSRTETLVAGICRLPPGRAMVVDAGGLTTCSYWNPSRISELRYRSDGEYAEHLRELTIRAVRSRLRTRGTAGVMLSGGVDSSSIAGISADLFNARSASSAGVETFSLSTGDAGDERAFFEQVTARHQLRANVVGTSPLRTPSACREEIARSLELPTYPNGAAGDSLRACVRERDIRVLLTGVGADEWLDGSIFRHADLFGLLRWITLAREIAEDRRTDAFAGWLHTAKSTAWPFAPRALRPLVRRVFGRGQPPAWIDPAFSRRVDLPARVGDHDHGLSFRTHELSDLWHEGVSGWATHDMEMFDRTGARAGIEHRHPFCDRRIVEFAFSLPAEQRHWRGLSKPALRRAMAPFLPPPIASRLTSPNFSRVIVETLHACGVGQNFTAPAIAARGWVREPALKAAYQRMHSQFRAGGDGYSPGAGAMWMVYGVELWARTVLDEEHHGAKGHARRQRREETVREAEDGGVRKRREADDGEGVDAQRVRRPEEESLSVG